MKLPHFTDLPHPVRYLAHMLTQLLRPADPFRSLCIDSFLHQRQLRFNCLEQKWVILWLIDEFNLICAVIFVLGARVLKAHFLGVCPLFFLDLLLAISNFSYMLTIVIKRVTVNLALDLAHACTYISHGVLLFLMGLITSLALLSQSLISSLLQLFLLCDLMLYLHLTPLVELVLSIPCRHEPDESLRLGTLE